MNSYNAVYEGVYDKGINLIIDLGFGLTLKKTLKLADIEILDNNYGSAILNYCVLSRYQVTISVNDKEEIYLFNGIDNNHINAVLVEQGLAKFI